MEYAEGKGIIRHYITERHFWIRESFTLGHTLTSGQVLIFFVLFVQDLENFDRYWSNRRWHVLFFLPSVRRLVVFGIVLGNKNVLTSLELSLVGEDFIFNFPGPKLTLMVFFHIEWGEVRIGSANILSGVIKFEFVFTDLNNGLILTYGSTWLLQVMKAETIASI